DLDGTVALARLAAAALDVEGEAARLVAALARLGGAGEQVADVGEDAGVGGGVGARRAADRALVDLDDLVDVLGAPDARVGAGLGLGAVELLGQRRVQDAFHQRRLARARGARHAGEGAEREVDVDALEVVLARAHHGELAAVALAALLG